MQSAFRALGKQTQSVPLGFGRFRSITRSEIRPRQSIQKERIRPIGGGDTVAYIEERKLVDSFGHVSTGGGASLELMAGRKLPGVEVLLDKVG